MTDKVQKIREEVVRLKSNLIYGACASQIAMETYCKEEAYDEVLAILDTIREESVSEDLEEAADEYAPDFSNSIASKAAVDAVRDAFKAGSKWQKEKDNEEKVLTYKHGFNDCKEHIEEVLLSEVLPCFMHGGEADEVVAKLDEVLN